MVQQVKVGLVLCAPVCTLAAMTDRIRNLLQTGLVTRIIIVADNARAREAGLDSSLGEVLYAPSIDAAVSSAREDGFNVRVAPKGCGVPTPDEFAMRSSTWAGP